MGAAVTVTLKEQVLVLPARSVAVQVTALTPMGKEVPVFEFFG